MGTMKATNMQKRAIMTRCETTRSTASKLTRRGFIGATALGTATLFSPLSRVLGANGDIRLGFIGLGGRGGSLLGQFAKEEGVRIVALCDADKSKLDRFAEQHPHAARVTDMRRLIERRDIDAVVIATSNHWHALSAIWAMQAGKDVYLEKPCSHNVWEGRKLVEAARKYDRIVQGGTQQRSDPMQSEIKAFLDSGELGRIQYVRLNRLGVRASIGRRSAPLEIPDSVEYDLWLGPAEDRPIYRDRLQYDWHWDWNTGNGELGNWGVHILDDCRNVVFRDKATLPRRVVAGGGRFLWNDAGNTPNTQFVYYDTGSIPVVMAVHNLPRATGAKEADIYQRLETRAFLVIQCENGYYAGSRGRGAAFSNERKQIKAFDGNSGRGHAGNFLQAVRSRKRADLTAEIEQTHYAAAWAHLGNAAYRLGQTYNRGQALERVRGYGPWEELINGFEAHVRANGIVPDSARLGPMLEIDTQRETLTGPTATPAARALLTREYRKPYTVPSQV
jgi:predicted dehydrogenase